MAQGKKSIGGARDAKPQGGSKKSVEHTLRVYMWIIGEFLGGPLSGFTFAELNERWVCHTELSGGQPMKKNMFGKYKNAICSVFGIKIECNHSNNIYQMAFHGYNTAATNALFAIAIHRLILENPELRDLLPSSIGEMQKDVFFELDSRVSQKNVVKIY